MRKSHKVLSSDLDVFERIKKHVRFYMKKIGGTAVFYAALIAEAFIVYAWIVELTAFLWLNVIGCLLVMGLAFVIQAIFNKRKIVA